MGVKIKDATDPTLVRVWTCSVWIALEPIVIILLHNLLWSMTKTFRLCNRWRKGAAVWLLLRNGSLSLTIQKRPRTMNGSKNRKAPTTRRFNMFHKITNSSTPTIILCLIILVNIKAIAQIWSVISSHRHSRNPCKPPRHNLSRHRKKTLIKRNSFILNTDAGKRISHLSINSRRRKSLLKFYFVWTFLMIFFFF